MAHEPEITPTTELSTDVSSDPNLTVTDIRPAETEAEPSLMTSVPDSYIFEPLTPPDTLAPNCEPQLSIADHNTQPPPSTASENVETPTSLVAQESRRSNRSRSSRASRSQKPPMLLDTAICILLVLLFAIICRRMV